LLRRQENREAFDEGKFDRVVPNPFRARQPYGRSVTQFVELARLGAQNAREVMGRLAVQNGSGVFKPFDKESPAHRPLCYINHMGWCGGTKDARSQGAFRLLSAALLWLFLLACGAAQAQPRPAYSQRVVIVDTDAGSDDLMAIAFLLSRADIHVEAITIVNGMAHVQAGGRNVLRLLALAGRHDVRVYLGRETPISGTAEFPAEWRRNSDELPGVTLPEPTRAIESQPAAEFLARRLSDAAHPVQVLTLGPLTNLAEAFSHMPRAVRAIRQLVIMGGAVRVPGNLADGGAFKTDNAAAEWNMFIDPAAAKVVFASGAPIRLMPLDATQRVPIDMALLEQTQWKAETPVARFVAQVLATNRDFIRQGFYFAWDPLAAVALANPAVATFKPLAIEISQKPQDLGRTTEIKGRRANTQVAIDADRLRFRDIFMTALGVR
jgi:inosine-uridine nucleoside N-ribohydrolase